MQQYKNLAIFKPFPSLRAADTSLGLGGRKSFISIVINAELRGNRAIL